MHKNLVGESLWNVDAQESCWRQFVKCECTRIFLGMLWDENAKDSCLRELVKWECSSTLMERVCEVRMHKNLVGESLWVSETTFQLPVVFRMWLKLYTYCICKLWKRVLCFGTQQLDYVLMDAKAYVSMFMQAVVYVLIDTNFLMFFWILKVCLCCWCFGDCIFQGDVYQWNNGGSNILNNVPSFPLDLQSPRSFRKG